MCLCVASCVTRKIHAISPVNGDSPSFSDAFSATKYFAYIFPIFFLIILFSNLHLHSSFKLWPLLTLCNEKIHGDIYGRETANFKRYKNIQWGSHERNQRKKNVWKLGKKKSKLLNLFKSSTKLNYIPCTQKDRLNMKFRMQDVKMMLVESYPENHTHFIYIPFCLKCFSLFHFIFLPILNLAFNLYIYSSISVGTSIF